jgi:hypothetical protein
MGLEDLQVELLRARLFHECITRCSRRCWIGGGNGQLTKVLGVLLAALILGIAISATVPTVSAHTPQKGDYFQYSQTINVNNGQGSYSGYTDQSQVTGKEQVTSVTGSNVSASYDYSYQYSSSQGTSTSTSSSGGYVWSSSSFTYVNGTDNQVGFSKPIYVWFAMNSSLPIGGNFHVLNSQFTVLSKNYSLLLPTESDKYVQVIQAEGSGQYQRNDSYGVFTASYTWDAYFDPSTGYVVGYNYVEQDNGQYQGQAGSFTYTDTLYVTSTSYALALASAPTETTSPGSTTTTPLGGLDPYVAYLIGLVVVLFLIAIVIYAATRRGRKKSLPKHPYSSETPPPAPSSTPWESRIDLGSKPPEEVVIRDVAKVNCKYCGTLIPTTAERCPYCGGPRR